MYYERMKQAREAAKESQRMAANALNIEQPHYNRYETGKVELPIRLLAAFCRHYKVSADWILGLKDKEEVN